MKNRTLITAALAATMLVGSFATASAHHRTPSIQFNDAALGADLTVSLNEAVTVRGEAFDNNAKNVSATLERCVLDGTHVASDTCDNGSGTWLFVTETSGPSHAALTYAAATHVAGVFGYRVISGGYGEDGTAHSADTADLTVESSNEKDRHNACNGIENAHAKSNGNGKQKLAEHADKFGCDID